jgi:hypothetical protein
MRPLALAVSVGLALALATSLAPRAAASAQGRPGKEGKPTEKAEVPTIGGAAPTQPGAAPQAVQLGEPVQPTQLQTRAGGAVVGDQRARYRTVVRMMINIERAHRDRFARLERLRELFTASGATESLAAVEHLRGLETKRYEAAMLGYERGLGPSLYAQVRAVIDANGIPANVTAPVGKPADPAAGAPAGSKSRGDPKSQRAGQPGAPR